MASKIATGTSSLTTGDVERGTTPLIMQKTQINRSDTKIKEVHTLFFNFFDTMTPDNKPEKLEEFKNILDDENIKNMEELYKQERKELEKITTHIPEKRSFLHRFGFQGILAKMLNDIAEYAEFLKLFIERFAAYKEYIEPNYLPTYDTGKNKTKKQRRPTINNDPRTMQTLDTPLHCAVRQLNKGFLEWLLEQPETEVNLRNKRRETALAILCQMYDWSKEIMPKLKPRLKDIEEERETADKMQQIWLDDEKIELVALEKQLKEEPTILNLMKTLLEKGADFNIYMNEGALPFDFLRKYDTEADVAEIINAYTKSNVAMTEKPPKQSNISAERKNDSKKRIVKFYMKTEDMDVRVTVELLEIFICFKDLEKFKQYYKDFPITSDNVKKFITLLLHEAVVLNYTNYVENIIEKASKEIFKLEKNKEENKMVHRIELKGLLKTVCLNGNKALLRRFLMMMNDRLLVNENPLLINALNGAYTMKSEKESIFLLECIKILINNHSKVDMYRVDRNGNTALHLALSYGYEKIALLMLKQGHGLIGFRNRQNLTPIECGTTEFWNTYLDSCISTNNDESELRFNIGFLKPRAKDESSDTSKSSSLKWYRRWIKRVEEMKPASKYRFTHTVNDMTALCLISQSNRKEFLMHPVIIAFITMKWKRFCHWITLDLLLTTITMGTFIGYTLMPCPSAGWKYGLMAGVGGFIIFVRECMQLVLLGWSYVTLENVVDIINVVLIGIVLRCGCERDGWCEYVPICSSVVVVSLAFQVTFLLGALWNKLSITLYMFKTISRSFFYSLLSFTPVIGAFIYSFHRISNEPSGISISNGTKSNSSEENFNNFHSAWDATIKTLVMTTGEFEAANSVLDGGKWLLFVAFLFIAPIVILNLINGLAVSDIAAIRQESEFISIYRKIKLLERYERAIVESRSTMPGCLEWLFRDPLVPSSFFEKYESIVYVLVNEKNKLAIKSKKNANSAKEAIPGFPWLPNFCLKLYIGIRSFQFVLYMSLDQSYVEKAKTIVRRQSKTNSGLGTSELGDAKQTDRPALVNKTAMNQHNTIALSKSGTGPSVPDSRDKQIEMLQEQVRSMTAKLNNMQHQLSGNHVSKAESTVSTSKDQSKGQ